MNGPGYETERINALRSYNILDTLSEAEYDNITFLASMICDVPVAVISFVDVNRQWFKSRKGLGAIETAREYSFCAHAINSPQEFFIVPDSREDERFRTNPLVTGDPNIVFYAGVPLTSQDGYGLGTVCVIDKKPRALSEDQLKALKILSSQVMQMLETRKSNEDLKRIRREMEKRNAEMKESTEKLERSEEQLRKMSEGSDVMITVLDEDKEPVYITKAWSVLTGKSIDELLLFGWKDRMHKADIENYDNAFHEAFENREPYTVEFRILNSQGAYTWLLTKGSPDFLSNGKFNGYITSTFDLTDLKNTETDLGRTTKQLEMALQAGKFGTYEMNLRSGSLKTSAEYLKNIGLDGEQSLTFSGLLANIVAEDRPAIHHSLARAIRENAGYENEYRVNLPDGGIAWIKESGVPVYNESGEAVKISGISLNITEQKNFTAELEARVAARTHDLNARFLNLENMMNR